MGATVMPENLKLVLGHLSAVRELDRYLHDHDEDVFLGEGLVKDLERYIKEGLRPAIENLVPTLKDWHGTTDREGVNWFPESWKLRKDFHVALTVVFPEPLGSIDPDPSVNLCVPKSRFSRAIANRSTPWAQALLGGGFGHIDDNQDWQQDFPIGRYVPWLERDGSFAEQSLLERIASEAMKIVNLEPTITEALRSVLTKPSKKTSPSSHGPAKVHQRKPS